MWNPTIPAVDEPVPLKAIVEGWRTSDGDRRIIFCDESEDGADPLSVLAAVEPAPLAVLIGPEGGFSEDERQMLKSQSFVTPLPLGPRILRADTAAVAALAVVQAVLGDWKGTPPKPI